MGRGTKKPAACCQGKFMWVEPQKKIMVKNCKKSDPPPPPGCGPPVPCNPEEDPDAECPQPNLCTERIKNPQSLRETRCQEGNFIPVASCRREDPPHPCDPPPPCIPGKPKALPCPPIALCRQSIKNPEPTTVRCPSPNDIYSDILCQNINLFNRSIEELRRELKEKEDKKKGLCKEPEI